MVRARLGGDYKTPPVIPAGLQGLPPSMLCAQGPHNRNSYKIPARTLLQLWLIQLCEHSGSLKAKIKKRNSQEERTADACKSTWWFEKKKKNQPPKGVAQFGGVALLE